VSRWVVLKRRVGAVTSQRVLKVLFYVNILQWFFVVENFTANAVSVAIGDNGNRLIFLSTDCLVLYVTWRPFVFLNQFDLNLFMRTTENSSIFRLLTKESMLLTSATLGIRIFF
jgi:hypothetical protein